MQSLSGVRVGLGKEGLLTARPQPGSQRALPAAPRPPRLRLTLCPLLIAGIYGHCPQYQMSLRSATPQLPSCPSPTKGCLTLPLELSRGRAGPTVPMSGPGKGFRGTS